MAARMRDAWVGKVGCMPGVQVGLQAGETA